MIPPSIAALASRIGLTGLAIAILLALLAVQTVRIEGFRMWPLSIDGWKARALTAEQTIRDIEKAQADALARAELAKAKAEADYRNLAERIDDETEQARESAMDAAERFIAANRVRCEATGRAAGGPAPAAEDRGARDGDAAGGAPELDEGFVAVEAADVRICTANTLQAEAAREWALEMEAASE